MAEQGDLLTGFRGGGAGRSYSSASSTSSLSSPSSPSISSSSFVGIRRFLVLGGGCELAISCCLRFIIRALVGITECIKCSELCDIMRVVNYNERGELCDIMSVVDSRYNYIENIGID